MNPRLPAGWTGGSLTRVTNASVVDLPRKGELGSQGSSGPIRSGVSKAAVVLADRFGCRSRRAARGHERPHAKSARKRQGLAPLLRDEGAKERRKPDRGGEVPGSVAGLRSRASRESAAAEQALVDGRRPGPFGAVTFDEGAGKAVSAMRDGPTGLRVSRQGRQRSTRSTRPRKTTPRNEGCHLWARISIGGSAGLGGVRTRRIGGRVKCARPSSRCVVKRIATRVVCWG